MSASPAWLSTSVVRTASVTALLLHTALLGNAGAQPAPGTSDAPPPVAAKAPTDEPERPSESSKQEAREHFERGMTLFQQEAWAPALAEFRRSRELYPGRPATNYAAMALRKLQRFDEAFDLYELMLRDFPNMAPSTRSAAQRELAELRELVGTIEISGAEPGASIVIGGLARGEYPPVTPLRVAAGAHVVRVFKEGFEPLEKRVEVAGGESARLMAKLKRLTDSGRLKVIEGKNRPVDVLIDSMVVGKTPWEGLLAVGKHTVQLSSGSGSSRIGTQPSVVQVMSQRLQPLTLTAEPLDCSLQVRPKPETAEVRINSVTVGLGQWSGWLKAGAHKVEIRAPGYQPVVKELKLERGGREVVTADLARDEEAPQWRKPSKFVFDASLGVALVPSFGGDVAGKCDGGCTHSLGVGPAGMFHASYELGSGFGIGLSGGYLFVAQEINKREAKLIPYGKDGNPPAQEGFADDKLRLSAFMGGVAVSYHLGERFPVLVRLGGGALVGQFRDEREGSFKPRSGEDYRSEPAAHLTLATFAYAEAELRAGWRFADHFELSGGARAMILVSVPKPPTWNEKIEIPASTDGAGTYPADALTGNTFLMVVPTANLRYDF